MIQSWPILGRQEEEESLSKKGREMCWITSGPGCRWVFYLYRLEPDFVLCCGKKREVILLNPEQLCLRQYKRGRKWTFSTPTGRRKAPGAGTLDTRHHCETTTKGALLRLLYASLKARVGKQPGSDKTRQHNYNWCTPGKNFNLD